MDRDHEADERLMQRVAEGAPDAIGVLIRRHAVPVLTFIERMIGDRHRAEDLFQEVFLAVWVHRRSYRQAESFRPWLFGIAANKCRAYLRWRAAIPFTVDGSESLADGREPSPAESAMAAETAAAVADAIAGLPTAQRLVATLRIWNGMSYSQIAQVVWSNESTVRSNMFHALAALRKRLQRRLHRSEEP
jgi:RNA polymerase sigma-70 factor (ECF subfamily)